MSQRAEALAKAAEARKARSELLASIKSGKQSIDKVLLKAKEDKTIGKTKVTQLLKAVPGLGAVKVAALLEQAGIDPDRRAAGLGEEIRVRLPEREMRGRFRGLDEAGRLQVEQPGGLATVTAGEVFGLGGT